MAIGDGMKGEEQDPKGGAAKNGGGFVSAEKYVMRRAI
jgi:hypothetical protein